MPEEINKKFNEIMKNAGMEQMTKTNQERFGELMEKGGVADLDKPVVYIAKCPHWQDPSLEPTIIKFNSRKERDEWYKSQGVKIEETFDIKLEMPENPVPNDDFDKKGK